jgi:hypothetical protein
MQKELIVSTQIVEIPLDIKDIADFRKYSKALEAFTKLEKKAKSAAKRICRAHFVLKKEELIELLSDEQLMRYLQPSMFYDKDLVIDEKIVKSWKADSEDSDDNSDFAYYVINHENKTIEPIWESRIVTGWIMGARTSNKYSYKFVNSETIQLTIKWESQEARFSHVQWIQHEKSYTFDISKL